MDAAEQHDGAECNRQQRAPQIVSALIDLPETLDCGPDEGTEITRKAIRSSHSTEFATDA